MNAVGGQLFEIQALHQVDAPFDQQPGVHRLWVGRSPRVRRRLHLERLGVAARGDHPAVGEQLGGRQIRTGRRVLGHPLGVGAMAGDVEEHAAGEQRGQARRIADRRAEVTEMVRGVGPVVPVVVLADRDVVQRVDVCPGVRRRREDLGHAAQLHLVRGRCPQVLRADP